MFTTAYRTPNRDFVYGKGQTALHPESQKNLRGAHQSRIIFMQKRKRKLSFRDIDRLLALATEMLREVIDKAPVEVLVHVTETMALIRQHKHVKALSSLDQGIDYTACICRMDVVIDLAMNKHKMSLEILGNLRIGCNLIVEGSISLLGNLLLHTVMSLAPPPVVDIIVMVSGT